MCIRDRDSLRRLDVEHIDLYQIHAWDALTPVEETLRFLDDAVAAGKISYYGFSNYLGWQLTKAVHVAAAHDWTGPVTLQPQYSLLVRDIEHEVVPAALDAGIGLLPWSPLAGGWLSGKYQRDVDPTGATRLGENPDRGMEAWHARNAEERTWQVIDAVRIARAGGAGVARRPAGRHVGDPRRTVRRAAHGQHGCRGPRADRRGGAAAHRRQRSPGRRLPVRRRRCAAA